MRHFLPRATSALLAASLACLPAHAVSCTVGAAMSGEARSALFDAAHQLGGDVLRGDTAALKATTIPSVAANFDGIAGTITALAPSLGGATLTVTNLYALDAGDLAGTEEDVQFFCGVPGAPLLVTVTLSELPKGQFALAVLHATGIKTPQQFAMVLQNTAPTGAPHWQLAGFFARPLTMDGHDSAWFWQQGRELKTKAEPWSAFFYDQAATYLARPADLYSSNNLQKLSRETASAEPAGLPGSKPMMVPAEGQSFAVTGLRADGTLGALDLRVDTRVDAIADPVAARKDAITLMGALLKQHPELRGNFHGLWVYENTAAGQAFAVEQPMSALP
jgi:hypothetical protein